MRNILKKNRVVIVGVILLAIVSIFAISNGISQHRDSSRWETIMSEVDLLYDAGYDNHYLINGTKSFKHEKNDAVFLIFGHNNEKELGEIQFYHEGYEIIVSVYEKYYAIESQSEERRMHCTINYKYKPYDSGHFIFWVSGDNDTYYSRIDYAIGFETIIGKIEEFESIANDYYDKNI